VLPLSSFAVAEIMHRIAHKKKLIFFMLICFFQQMQWWRGLHKKGAGIVLAKDFELV
jgi:cellobiose-specific phosphotransferase system component IIC